MVAAAVAAYACAMVTSEVTQNFRKNRHDVVHQGGYPNIDLVRQVFIVVSVHTGVQDATPSSVQCTMTVCVQAMQLFAKFHSYFLLIHALKNELKTRTCVIYEAYSPLISRKQVANSCIA